MAPKVPGPGRRATQLAGRLRSDRHEPSEGRPVWAPRATFPGVVPRSRARPDIPAARYDLCAWSKRICSGAPTTD